MKCQLVKIRFLDHFTTNEMDKECILEAVGWKIEKNKNYTKLAMCKQDGEGLDSPFFNILNKAILEEKIYEEEK